MGIITKGMGVILKSGKKTPIRAKVVNETFKGKKYKYAGNLAKAKWKALPENVKKSIQRKQEKIDDAIFDDMRLSAEYRTSKKFGAEKKRSKGRYFSTLKGGQK
jgi:hypothetical protein